MIGEVDLLQLFQLLLLGASISDSFFKISPVFLYVLSGNRVLSFHFSQIVYLPAKLDLELITLLICSSLSKLCVTFLMIKLFQSFKFRENLKPLHHPRLRPEKQTNLMIIKVIVSPANVRPPYELRNGKKRMEFRKNCQIHGPKGLIDCKDMKEDETIEKYIKDMKDDETVENDTARNKSGTSQAMKCRMRARNNAAKRLAEK